MTVPQSIRQELIRLCSSGKTRRAEFTPKIPTFWNIGEVYDPRTKEPYTRDGAWARIVEELNADCPLEAVDLDHPPGKKGYAFKFKDGREQPIYVKLQIMSGEVRGRSFHIDRGKR